jgi:hypothetical protein
MMIIIFIFHRYTYTHFFNVNLEITNLCMIRSRLIILMIYFFLSNNIDDIINHIVRSFLYLLLAMKILTLSTYKLIIWVKGAALRLWYFFHFK